MNVVFTLEANGSYYKLACEQDSEGFCEALGANSTLDDSLWKRVRFGSDGRYEGYSYNYGAPSYWYQYPRQMVTDPKDGDFVSVFPGTYGIQWRYEDGVVEDTYGIKVK